MAPTDPIRRQALRRSRSFSRSRSVLPPSGRLSRHPALGPLDFLGSVVTGAVGNVALVLRPEAALAVATEFTFPLVLAIAVLLFLVVQDQVDRRDPKLRVAPQHQTDDLHPLRGRGTAVINQHQRSDEYTALSDRMGYLLLLRLAMAAVTLAWAAIRPEALGMPFATLLAVDAVSTSASRRPRRSSVAGCAEGSW